MSLIKKHTMTEKKLAGNRRNQKFCHGPVTDEGRERIRAALRRFGYNAPAEEAAMRALGEEPADFQELLEGLWEEWDPAGASQEGVVISLARALWLMNRAARMQEGYAVRQATEVSSGRQDRLHVQMMRLKMTEERLQRVAQAVANEHYVTTPEDLERMKNLHQEGVLKEMGEIALALLYQLQPPDTGEDGVDRNEQQRRVLVRIKEIFGLNSDTPPAVRLPPASSQPQDCQQDAGTAEMPPGSSPAPADLPTTSGQVPAGAIQPARTEVQYPRITAEEWEARERPRQLLENLLTRQVETCKAQRKAILKESVKGPSPYERAAEIAPTHPDARLMRRMQDSNLREVRRLTNLLLKFKRYERQREALAKTEPFQDVPETEGVSRLE